MRDYSGDFESNLKLSDLDNSTLADLAALYGKLYAAMDGFWYLAVKEKLGDEEALACDIRAWERACKYEMAKITKLLDIQGNGIEAMMKAIQVTPWLQQTQFHIELTGPDSAVLTVDKCPTLNSLEKEGEGRESLVCRVAVPKLFENYAAYFSPDIVIKGIALPPRKSKEGISCRWEFSLEPKP
ncbi:DUF6125 family protein [Bacteroidota bacterium]